MKAYQKMGLVLTLGLGFTAGANSAVLSNSISSQIVGSQGIPPGWIADAFSTGANCPNGCTLGDITLILSGNFGSPLTGIVLQLYSDSGTGIPGTTLIGDPYINPTTVTSILSENVFKPDPADATVLSANTTYWVKLDASAAGAASVDWAYATDSVSGQWAFDTLDGSNGFGDTGPYMMKVEANPISAVPVPAAAWLMGSGLIGLVASWRRQKAA